MGKSKKLTTLELYWYIIGGSVGSGLFIMLPMAIGFTGKATIFACLFGALIAFFAQIYNVIIASFFPVKGGDYGQIAFMSPPVVGGLYGWAWIILGLGTSAYAVSAVSYLGVVFPGVEQYTKLISFVLVTVFFALNYFGTKNSAKVEGAMTVVMLVSLALFVIMGLPKIDYGHLFDGNTFNFSFSTFAASSIMCSYAVMGATIAPVGVASEVENPTRTIPRAQLIGSVIMLLIGGLIIFVASQLTPAGLEGENLAYVAKEIFPDWLFVVFTLGGAVLALLTTLLSSITMLRYPFEQMAQEGWLPSIFKKTTKNGWPVYAMVVMYVLALITIVFNVTFDQIITMMYLPQYAIILYVIIKCMWLPHKYPEHWKKNVLHMPMPLYYVLCAIGICASAYSVYGACAEQDMATNLFSLGLTVAMLLCCWLMMKTRHVKLDYINAQREEIISEALNAAKD